MKELYDTGEPPKRAFLVGIRDDKTSMDEADSLAREMAGLARTLGLELIAQETVHVRENHSRFGVGTGKAQELAESAAALGADCLILDWDSGPSQQRNWEDLTGVPAMDRQELIIQIFAGRARTREAELQVALAELTYELPRLQHRYIDLARQRGGRYGTRGAGETRRETDRRLVEERIRRLEEELEGVRKNRTLLRKKREKTFRSCALVGYTNAGKSSLLNALTGAGVFVEDKLFATLDTTTRVLPGKGKPILLTDTVGFIRRLPHALVDAFRSTLEEVSLADLLIHVLDASDGDADRYFEATIRVLQELGAGHIPMITVLNKIDRLESRETLDGLLKRYPGSIPLSARDRSGLEELKERMEELLSGDVLRFRFPPDRHDLAALLHRDGRVIAETYEDAYIEMEARAEKGLTRRLREYLTPVSKD
jgi:GTP-binding protein HflX